MPTATSCTSTRSIRCRLAGVLSVVGRAALLDDHRSADAPDRSRRAAARDEARPAAQTPARTAAAVIAPARRSSRVTKTRRHEDKTDHLRAQWHSNALIVVSVTSLLLAHDVELGGVGDRHHGHHAGLNRVGHDEVGHVGHAAGHVQRDHEQSLGADLLDRASQSRRP